MTNYFRIRDGEVVTLFVIENTGQRYWPDEPNATGAPPVQPFGHSRNQRNAAHRSATDAMRVLLVPTRSTVVLVPSHAPEQLLEVVDSGMSGIVTNPFVESSAQSFGQRHVGVDRGDEHRFDCRGMVATGHRHRDTVDGGDVEARSCRVDEVPGQVILVRNLHLDIIRFPRRHGNSSQTGWKSAHP